MLVLQLGLDLVDLAEDLGPLHLLVGRVDRDVRLVGVVQEGEHPVILFLRERVELVAVALGALDRQPEDALADRVHAVEHRLHAELLGIDAPFLVDHRVAQEAGGHELVLRRRPGSRSPAICSMMNWSYGRSRLRALMTQSR